MSKVTLLTILVVVLVIINGISLFMQFNRHDKRREGMPNPRSLFKQLDLDKQQEDQFEQLRIAHFKKRDSLRSEDMRFRKEMAAMITYGITDSVKIDSITGLLANNRKQFEQNFYNHFQQLYSLLKPEQKPKFIVVINEIIQRQSSSFRRESNKPPPHKP